MAMLVHQPSRRLFPVAEVAFLSRALKTPPSPKGVVSNGASAEFGGPWGQRRNMFTMGCPQHKPYWSIFHFLEVYYILYYLSYFEIFRYHVMFPLFFIILLLASLFCYNMFSAFTI